MKSSARVVARFAGMFAKSRREEEFADETNPRADADRREPARGHDVWTRRAARRSCS